jgi:hypothetical protein
MLNTDLHRANADEKKHKRKRMSKDEFINNLRGSDNGNNIDRNYLSMIYDNIANCAIELAVESSESSFSHKVDTYNNINNNTNKNSISSRSSNNNNNNSLSAGQSLSLSSSAEISTTTTNNTNNNTNNNNNNNNINNNNLIINLNDEKQFQKDASRTIRDSEDLLRSLSPFTYPFQLANIDTHISIDLVSFMLESVWLHFYAIIDSVLSTSIYDLNIIIPVLDILYYSLCSSLLLNGRMERRTFALQLKTFQNVCRNNANKTKITISSALENDDWYNKIDIQTMDSVIDFIADIHRLFILLKDFVQQSVSYEITRQMASKIEKKAKVLENNTFFVSHYNNNYY